MSSRIRKPGTKVELTPALYLNESWRIRGYTGHQPGERFKCGLPKNRVSRSATPAPIEAEYNTLRSKTPLSDRSAVRYTQGYSGHIPTLGFLYGTNTTTFAAKTAPVQKKESRLLMPSEGIPNVNKHLRSTHRIMKGYTGFRPGTRFQVHGEKPKTSSWRTTALSASDWMLDPALVVARARPATIRPVDSQPLGFEETRDVRSVPPPSPPSEAFTPPVTPVRSMAGAAQTAPGAAGSSSSQQAGANGAQTTKK